MRWWAAGALVLGAAGCTASVGAAVDAGAGDVDAPTDAAIVRDAAPESMPDVDAACARSPIHDQVCQDDTGHPYGFACFVDADAGAGCVAALGWPGVMCCDSQ